MAKQKQNTETMDDVQKLELIAFEFDERLD
jgi:hypothetical protein